MTEADPKNLRSRFYLSEIARWLLVVFFFLVLLVWYLSDDESVAAETITWLMRLRDITLGAGLILLAVGNFMRLSGSPMHQKLRWFWLILAVVFTIFWLLKGTSYMPNQIA